MPRLHDWAHRLDKLVSQALLRPFEWGHHDCCLWAADAVLAQTGNDPAAAVRGTYSDAAGAMRVLRAQGGLRGAAARAGVEIAPLLATTGDVGLVRGTARALLGVCAHDCWLVVTAAGLKVLPYRSALQAWRVSHG
jgi:hypothetical protein